MATFSNIPCTEVHGTRTEGMSVTGNIGYDASVTLRCAWASRAALVDDLLLSPRAWPFAVPGGITPVAISCGVKPEPTSYEQNGQVCDYPYAHVTVGYTLTYENPDGTEQPGDRVLVAETLEPMVEYNTVPATDKNCFMDSSADEDGFFSMARFWTSWESQIDKKLTIGYPAYSMRLTRTLSNLSTIPPSALTNINTINSADYYSALLDLNFPKGTLLFEPPSLSRSISLTGSAGWNCTAKFHYKKETWNRYWNPKSQAFEYIHQKPPTSLLGGIAVPILRVFKEADFSDWLF